MTGILVALREAYDGGEHVAVHVVIDIEVVTLEEVVAIDLHLLAGDTRTLLHSGHGVVTIGELQSLHLVERLATVLHGLVEDLLYHGDEVLSVGYEVGLALHGHHGSEVVHLLHEQTSVGGLAVRTLGSDSQSALAEQVLSLVEVTFGLDE